MGSKVWAGEGDTSGGVSQSSGAAAGLGGQKMESGLCRRMEYVGPVAREGTKVRLLGISWKGRGSCRPARQGVL